MSDPVPAVRALDCPGCGGALEVRAAGYTVSLVCDHCRATIDMTAPEPRLIAAAAEALAAPFVPLGSRGTLDGVEWEIAGFLQRAGSGDIWDEYLLFNPYHGYRFLVDDDRSWSLGRLLDRTPKMQSGGWTSLDGVLFEQFDKSYRATVRFVVGEFYWRVAVGESVQVRDFVRPGTMLSREENDSEISWTQLEILKRGVVEKAFGVEPRGPGWGAPSPHEPSPWLRQLWPALIVALIAFFALMGAAAFKPSRAVVQRSEIQMQLDAPEKTFVIGPLVLPDRYAGIAIRSRAPGLDNSWVDLDYSLVRRRTQDSFDAYGVAEYYRGVDSDGSWSEGDISPVTKLSSVPAGTYDLVVDASAHRWNPPTDIYGNVQPTEDWAVVAITIEKGTFFGGNLLLALLLIIAWPIALIGLHMSFERRRLAQSSWSES